MGPGALLVFVALFMGFQGHFYHKNKELLKVNCTIFIDIQLSEPGICIPFL